MPKPGNCRLHISNSSKQKRALHALQQHWPRLPGAYTECILRAHMRGCLLHHPEVQASCSGRLAERTRRCSLQPRTALLHQQRLSHTAQARPSDHMAAHAGAVAMPESELQAMDDKDHEAFMQNRADFLKEDLKHLFDDKVSCSFL